VWNVLLSQKLREIPRRARIFIIALTRRNENIALVLEHIQISAAEMRQIFDGIVEINIFV
jgi:hypothetical protein